MAIESLNCDCADSDEKKASCLGAVCAKCAGDRSALLLVLHQAQRLYGYLSSETIEFIAEKIKIPVSEIMGIITFYSFFATKPRGKNHILVCTGTACYVQGAQAVLDKCIDTLKIADGDATEDGVFSLQSARCFGACGLAPAISCNEKYYRQMTPVKVATMLNELTSK